jgi:uncharacterized protein (DUF4415 family)
MKGEHVKKASSKKYSAAQMRMLNKLAAMKDSEIDFSDIPEQRNWKGAKRGMFFKPVKQQLTLRLDADVVDWFKRQGEGYQTQINAVLRKHVERKEGRGLRLSLSDFFQQSRACPRICEFALPDHGSSPSYALYRGYVPAVAPLVVVEFVAPVGCVGLRLAQPAQAVMGVPEAAVDKNRKLVAGKREVG